MKKGKEPQYQQLALSNRAIETNAQIQQVLQVIGLTSSALGHFQHQHSPFFSDGEVPRDPPPLKMTEGQIALEKTLWAACSRMESILGDDKRWSDEFQRKVEKEYDDLHALQMEAVEKQRQAAAEVTSPHFRYRPDLKRMRNGQWMAILGDENHLEFAVYGIGDSAQQALEEFDCVFNKGVPISVLVWAQLREKQVHQPFPNQEQIHEKNDDDIQMDPDRNDAGSNPPK